jgi:AcrR family transcriptional regulator
VVEERDTRMRILAAAKSALLDAGYANLATRGIAEAAGVPLSQIHYHFGSKQKLVLAVLDMENQQRLARQAAMYQSNLPLWKQWQQACDFFDEDLDSGYVRVLMEMTAAGWSNQEIADAVSAEIQGWFDLLAAVAQRAAERFGSLGPFTPQEVAALAGLPFLGAEAVILLGLDESKIAARPALRKIGELLRLVEEPPERGGSNEGPIPRL